MNICPCRPSPCCCPAREALASPAEGSSGVGCSLPSHRPVASPAQGPLPAAASLPTPSGTGTSPCSLGESTFLHSFLILTVRHAAGADHSSNVVCPVLDTKVLLVGISGTRVIKVLIKIENGILQRASTYRGSSGSSAVPHPILGHPQVSRHMQSSLEKVTPAESFSRAEAPSYLLCAPLREGPSCSTAGPAWGGRCNAVR